MGTAEGYSDIGLLSHRLKLTFGDSADLNLVMRIFTGNPPLKGAFGVSAHPHLSVYATKRALGLPAEPEFNAFFDDLARQDAEDPNRGRLFPEARDREKVRRIVDQAIEKIRAPFEPESDVPHLRPAS